MVLEAKGSIAKRSAKSGKYKQYFIYVPSSLSNDSAFPFKSKNGKVEVTIKIDGDRLIIEKSE